METELTQLLLRMQSELTKAIQESEQRSGVRIDQLTAQVRIANGRTGKLELAQRAMRARLDRFEIRLRDSGSIFASMTKAQKAKLTALAVLVAGAAAEGLQRLIPILLAVLSGKASQP